MANVTTELKVVVRSVGKGEIDKLSKALNDLGSKAAKPVNQTLKNSVGELKKLSSQSKTTRNNVKGFSAAFKELANNLEVGSKEFKEATAEAAKLDKQLASLEKRKPSRGQQLRRGAQTAGAVAASGVFGGPEGALGAGIGAVFGGPAGAAVGGAIGAQVGQLRQALGATADYSSGLDKLRIALRGVTTSQEEYSQGLAFIQQTTKDFAVPQEVVTRQFTKLQASVQGAGGNLEDTKTAFNGIVAAVRATGGSLADVDAALTATAQVFSKGKVSAEELRQQIGERLPGAFTLFAESMGLTPQELDKALEDGKVSLQDFQKFAKAIFDRYGENAKAIAQAPQSAGDRLRVALEKLNETVGTLLQPIGAAFQETFTGIVNAINAGITALNNFLGIGVEGAINKAQRELDSALKGYERFQDLSAAEIEALDNRTRQRFLDSRRKVQLAIQRLEEAQKGARPADIQQPEASGGLPGIIPSGAGDESSKLKERVDASAKLVELSNKLNEASRSGNKFAEINAKFAFDRQKVLESTLEPNQKIIKLNELDSKLNKDILNLLSARPEKIKEMNAELTETQKLFESVKNTIATGMANALEGIIFQTKSLGESLAGLAKSLASMLLQAGVQSVVGSIFPTPTPTVTGSAKGNIFANNKIVPFAYGGIVDKPTLFPMANGAGLMGEAGPEGILPLRRNAQGRLGVEASGAGVGGIVVNVDASGSSVEGDAQEQKALGAAIGAAVQAELIKQKRPGGLLF